MKRLLLARTVIAAVSVAIWGYGYRTDGQRFLLAGIGCLAVALVMRFIPRRWIDDSPA